MPLPTTYSEGGNPLSSFVNMHQTKEERCYKYRVCRALGYSVAEAQRFRDIRYSALKRILGIQMEEYNATNNTDTG